MSVSLGQSQSLQFTTVDAFTTSTTPFSGNPAAVIVLSAGDTRHSDASFMLTVAAEFNLSETAFLLPLPDSSDENPHYHLRWFTPAVEVPLCGHATLASAKVLLSMHPLSQLIRFETLSGTLTAERDGEKIALDLPAELTSRNRQTGGDLFEELRTMAEEAMPGSKGHVVAVAMGLAPIIELDSEVILKDMVVDSSVFLRHSHNIVYFTQSALLSDETCDIYTRVFGPGYGIAEDPVTGSAHAALAPYWMSQPAFKGNKTMIARQVSKRVGLLHLKWDEHVSPDRVRVSGQAVVVTTGTLHL